MTICVRIAIASHLSDAQELIGLGFCKEAQSQINRRTKQEQSRACSNYALQGGGRPKASLAKAILFKYHDTDKEVSEEELNKIVSQLSTHNTKRK